MPKPYKRKLEDFPQSIPVAWERALELRLDVTFPLHLKGKAVSFRHQMYIYRKRYQEDGRNIEKSAKMYEMELSILFDKADNKWHVKALKADWQSQILDTIKESDYAALDEIRGSPGDSTSNEAESAGSEQSSIYDLPSEVTVPAAEAASPKDHGESVLESLGFTTKETK